MSLLVIGTLAYDSVETAYDRRVEVLGGSATYFAAAASAFGPLDLVGIVGRDFKKEHLDFLTRRGVDTSGLEIAAGETFRWSGRYEADWNTRRTLSTHLNVLEDFDPKLPERGRKAQYLFLANGEPRVQHKALDQVEHPSFVMADTMNLWIEIAKEPLLHLLRRVDALVLNEEEARMLTGERSLLRAAGAVLGLGPRYVILKKGEHGAFLLSKDVHFSIPAYPVENVVDPTGAGDAFAGGFMGYLAAQGQHDPATLRKAMVFGTVTASFCVEGFSVEGMSSRSRTDVDQRYDELLSIVTV
jgi:sugar/nucleoside kinase (ribokinase family)